MPTAWTKTSSPAETGTITLTTLTSLLRTYAQESSTTPLTAAIAIDLINEGQERTAELVEYSVTTYTVTGGLVTNQYDYGLPRDLITVLSVSAENSDGDLEPLEGPLSLQQMDDEFSSWRTDAADRPLRYWIQQNAIWVHPKPSATYSGTALEVKATIWPADLAGSDVTTDLPKGFHRTLAKYAAYRWLSIDKENPTAQRMAGFWKNEWMEDVTRLRQLIHGRDQADGEGLRIERSRDSATSSSDLTGDDD